VDDELSESLRRLQADLRRSMEELAKRELTSVLQVEIAQKLIGGRRTVAELVTLLYALKVGDPGYKTHYSQVHKELRQMGAKGLVSRWPLGRDKPYRLTQMAIARLTMIGGVKPSFEARALPRTDMLIYGTGLGLGVMGAWLATRPVASKSLILVLCLALVFVGGAAFARFVETLRRVIL